MSVLVKNCVRNVLKISFPVRCATTEVYKYVSPQLVNYFRNIGLSSDELEYLNCSSYKLTHIPPENVYDILKVLESYNVDNYTAVTRYPRILCRKPSAIREYARVLEECGIKEIKPEYLISYFRIMKHKTIKSLKEESILCDNLNAYNHLCQSLKSWSPADYRTNEPCDDSQTLFSLRMKVLQKYLKWRLGMTKERFSKIIETYNRFYHRTLEDMEKSVDIAEDELKMSKERIVRNPFVISADPYNTLKIINEVKQLHGVDARDALRNYTMLIKEDYRHIMEVNKVLKEIDVPLNCKRRVLILYVYKIDQLIKRINELKSLPEIDVFSTNRRLPILVEYKKKVVSRLEKLKKKNVKCPSLSIFVCSEERYESKMESFGDKYRIGDVARAICGHLCVPDDDLKQMTEYLCRHTYMRNVPLTRIVDNIKTLSATFSHDAIMDNCHLLLYSMDSINKYLPHLMKLRCKHIEGQQEIKILNRNKSKVKLKARVGNRHQYISNDSDDDSDEDTASLFENNDEDLDFLTELNNSDLSGMNDSQILSLAMYFLERKFTFTCNGVWEYEFPEH